MLVVGSRRMHIWKVSRLSRCYSTPRCTWTGFRLGSGDPVSRPTLGCHVLRRLSSETLPGGSPSGYMVISLGGLLVFVGLESVCFALICRRCVFSLAHLCFLPLYVRLQTWLPEINSSPKLVEMVRINTPISRFGVYCAIIIHKS